MTTDTWRAVEGTTWQDRAPGMLRDLGLGPNGEPEATSPDRRWLWRLESAIGAYAPIGSTLEALRRDLLEFLRETCEHRWDNPEGAHYYEPDDSGQPKQRQCGWCHHTEDVAS